MKTSKGFTLIELMIVVAIVIILASIVGGGIINAPGKTQAQAESQGRLWTEQNNITDIIINAPGKTQAQAESQGRLWTEQNNITDIKRFSCAPDSDNDGYGTCTVVTETEKIFLQCVTGWYNDATGANGCKEVDTLVKLNVRNRG